MCERCHGCGEEIQEFSLLWFEQLERMIVNNSGEGIRIEDVSRMSLPDMRGVFAFLKHRCDG